MKVKGWVRSLAEAQWGTFIIRINESVDGSEIPQKSQPEIIIVMGRRRRAMDSKGKTCPAKKHKVKKSNCTKFYDSYYYYIILKDTL